MDAVKENKAFKYTLYAIGEIFLIIVGILIAVQINDWNENIKRQQEELKLFERMLVTCETERKILEFHISTKREAIASLNKIHEESLEGVQSDDSRPSYTLIVHRATTQSALEIEFGDLVSSISGDEVQQELRVCLNRFSTFEKFAQGTSWLLIEDTKVAIGPFLVKDYLEADAEFGEVDVHVEEFQQHYRESSEFRDLL